MREAFPSSAAPSADISDVAINRVAVRYVGITVAVMVLGAGWYLAYRLTGAGTQAWAYVFVPVSGFVAVAAVGHLLRDLDADPVARRFWRSLLVAFALVSAGYAWLAADMLVHASAATRSMPIPAAAVVAAGFGAAMWAVARVPTNAGGRVERRRMILDRTIAFLGSATVLWYFGLVPMLTAAEPWSDQAVALVALAFVVSLVGVIKVSYVAGSPVDRSSIRLVAGIGLVAAVVAVLAGRYGAAGSLPAQAIVMPLGGVLATLAVVRQCRSHTERRRRSRGGGTLLPYLAVVAVDIPLVAVTAGPVLRWHGRVVVLAAIVVTTLVTVRQFIAYRENARLLREKRTSEERLQHEVTHDGLTGLANRALFRERLGAVLRGR